MYMHIVKDPICKQKFKLSTETSPIPHVTISLNIQMEKRVPI